MAEVGAWAAFLTGATVLWGVVTAMGIAVLAPLHAPRQYWLLLGAPIGLGIAGTSSLVVGLLAIPWGWWVPLVFTGLVAGAAMLIGKRIRPAEKLEGPVTKYFWWVLAGTVVFVILQFGVTLLIMGYPNAVPMMGDAQFHLAGSQLVVESGNVNPFTALGQLYEPTVETSVHYYPVFWHALVATLSPMLGLPLAHNLWMFVVGYMVWPVGLAALAVLLVPRRPWVGAIAPLLAVSAFTFPVEALMYTALGPFSLGVVLVVPSTALAVLADSRFSRWWLPGLLVVLAGLAAHPSTGVLVLIPWAILALVAAVRWIWALSNNVVSVVGTFALFGGLLGVAALIMQTDIYHNYATYERQTVGVLTGLGALFTKGLFYRPLSIAWVLTSVLAVYGVFALWRNRNVRLVVAVAIPFLFLFVASTAQEGTLRGLTGLWWKDFARLIVPPIGFIVVLATAGLSQLVAHFVSRATKRPTKKSALVSVSVALLLGVAGIAAQPVPRLLDTVEYSIMAYSQSPKAPNPLDEHAAELLGTLDKEFTEGCVLGPHASGVGFAPVYSDLESCMPMPQPYTAAQQYLEDHFSDIHSDPHVCELVEENNIVAFLEKPPPDEETAQRQSGLYEVDTSEGFRLIGESGSVRLWEITACD